MYTLRSLRGIAAYVAQVKINAGNTPQGRRYYSLQCQLHLNSTSAYASDLNSAISFSFAVMTSIVFPLFAQKSDASLKMAALTREPVLSKPFSDLEIRYVSFPDGTTPDVVEQATQRVTAIAAMVVLIMAPLF